MSDNEGGGMGRSIEFADEDWALILVALDVLMRHTLEPNEVERAIVLRNRIAGPAPGTENQRESG